jgi:hypothetical protein
MFENIFEEIVELIPLIIAGIFLIPAVLTIFLLYMILKIKKKRKLKKQQQEAISSAELLNNLANEMDEKLRQEIEEAVAEHNRKNNVKIIENKEFRQENFNKNSNFEDDFMMKIRRNLKYFSQKANFFLDKNEDKIKTLNNYLEMQDFDNFYKKGKTELNNLSEKAATFLDKNEDKFRKIRDILKNN